MKIFGFPLSPYVRKAAVAAAEKGLDFDWEPSNPRAPSDEFLAVSPFSKIPGLQDGDFRIADSSAIVAYLDAKYPEPTLIPASPEARARAIWFDEVADTVLIPAGAPYVMNRFVLPKVLGMPGDEAAAVAAEEAVKRPLGYLESVMSEEGWLDGPFSIGDLACASCLRTLDLAGWKLDRAVYPKLAAWFDRVSARPAWQAIASREAEMFAALAPS